MILALKQTLAHAESMAWRVVAAKHRFVSRPQLSMPIFRRAGTPTFRFSSYSIDRVLNRTLVFLGGV